MASQFIKMIQKGVRQLNQAYSEQQIEKMAQFLSLMQEWNRAVNLTAITDPKEMVVKHILDSLAVAPFVTESSILDVGTGAGLPGVPLSIIYPSHQFVLLDKSSKRIHFLRHVKQLLGLDNVTLCCERVESLKGERFPCIISRAFASIDKLVAVCGEYLSEQGKLFAMTGQLDEKTVTNVPAGWLVNEPKKLHVPGLESTHYLVIIEKAK